MTFRPSPSCFCLAAGYGLALVAGSPPATAAAEKLPALVVAPAMHDRPAVADLERCLETMTGQDVPVFTNGIPVDRPFIRIGAPAAGLPGVKDAELTRLGPEGVILRTVPDGVVIAGRTPEALSHGIYALLDRLGCRWYFPGDAWEEIPRRQEIRLVPLDLTLDPGFADRNIWYGWGTGPVRQNQIDYVNWRRRNGQGGWFKGSVGHAYDKIASPKRDFAAHPDWFPLLDGKRRGKGQLCLSNPDVQQRAIAYARDYFRKHPDHTLVSLSPNDGGNYCQCEACRTIGSVSDQTLNLANIVAAAIHDEFPDRYVAMYAYYENCAPPAIEAHSNAIVYIATKFIEGGYTFPQLLDGWSAKAKALGVRDYYHVITWTRNMPRWEVDGFRNGIPSFHKKGVRAINAEASNCWAAEGLNYYVAARLMMDVDANVDALLEDFYTSCWHAAAPAMRRYYERLRQGSDMTERMLSLCLSDVLDASRLAEGDPVASRRVDEFLRYFHWVALYRKNAMEGSKQSAANAMHFAWRIRESNMLHAYAMFRELRMWRLGGATAAEIERWKLTPEPPPPVELPTIGEAAAPDILGPEAAGEQVSLDEPIAAPEPETPPPPTHEEIVALVRADLDALPEPIEVERREFSRDLVALTDVLDGALPAVEEHRPAYRSRNAFVLVPRHKGEVRIKITTGHVIPRRCNYEWAPLDGDADPVEGEVPKRGTHEVVLPVARAGPHKLELDSTQGAVTVDFGETPAALHVPGGWGSGSIIGGANALYLWVPPGTESFAVFLKTPDGFAKVKIWGPDEGSSVLNRSGNFAVGGEFAVRVPPSQAGAVWRLGFNRCEDVNQLELIGVPPYLAQRPDLLVIPRETAPVPPGREQD